MRTRSYKSHSMFMSAYAFNYKDAADRYIQILHETKQHINQSVIYGIKLTLKFHIRHIVY